MKRLGARNDAKEILNHPWFSEIDCNELLAKKITPSFQPKIIPVSTNSNNLNNEFDITALNEPVDEVLITTYQDLFSGFDLPKS